MVFLLLEQAISLAGLKLETDLGRVAPVSPDFFYLAELLILFKICMVQGLGHSVDRQKWWLLPLVFSILKFPFPTPQPHFPNF